MRISKKSDLRIALSFGLLTLLIGLIVSPRGFDRGFVDTGHDSYVLKVATDLNGGSTLFTQTFTQYGILGDPLNALILKFNNRLLFLKYFYSFIYGAAIAAFYLVIRKKSSRIASCLVTCFVILAAPFYRHGMMLSVHAPILLLQIFVVAILSQIQHKSSPKFVLLLGAMMALIFLFKQNVGAYQYLLVISLLIGLTYRKGGVETFFHQVLPSIGYFIFSTLAVLVPVFLYLQSKGSLDDWFVQTILFPRDFYSNNYSDALLKSSAASQAFSNYPTLNQMLPSILMQIIDAVISHPYWMLLRVCLMVLALNLFFNRSTRQSGFIMIFFLISGTLTLWPSSNFMHQWWTTVPVLIYLPFALNAWGNRKIHDGSSASRVNRVKFNSIINPLIVPTVGSIVAITLLSILVFGARHDLLNNNLFSFIINQKKNCVTISDPVLLSGICTDPKLARDLQIMSEQLTLSLSDSQKTNKLSRAVSINSEDGINATLISLLPVAALSNNASIQPVFWRLPVLTELYSDTFEFNFKNKDILIEIVNRENSPPEGYETTFELDYDGDQVWRIYRVK